jgi:broad specificity polyphosphatase/5'/3'-nucleotidase SurE
MIQRVFGGALVLVCATPALVNDDGLTSNIKATYDALKAAGHDVIVSVPCTGQSGRGAAIVM